MHTFYKPVDLRSRKEMIDFLSEHFRYPTMNSWNRATSYACNLKVDRLGLPFDLVLKLLDMLETQEFFDVRQELLDTFNAEHRYRWQAAFNGRSGGYLVLYQGELKSSNYFVLLHKLRTAKLPQCSGNRKKVRLLWETYQNRLSLTAQAGNFISGSWNGYG